MTDVVAYNHYFGWYLGDIAMNGRWLDEFHSQNPSIALGLSEYGAEGNIALHSENPHVRDYTEEYQCVYHEGMLETFAARPYIWGTYLWNMFEFGSDMRDEGMVKGRNNKGLVNFARTVKKDAFYLYKTYWGATPFVHICGRRFVNRCGNTTAIKVYASGADEVLLTVNGIDPRRVKGERIFRFDAVPLNPGINEIKAVGYCGGEEKSGEQILLNRVKTPDLNYIMPADESRADSVSNWFDEDLSGERLSLHEGFLCIKDNLGDVMENPLGQKLVMAAVDKFAKELSGGAEGHTKIDGAILNALSGTTVEEVLKMAGQPKELIIAFNKELQKIKKDED